MSNRDELIQITRKNIEDFQLEIEKLEYLVNRGQADPIKSERRQKELVDKIDEAKARLAQYEAETPPPVPQRGQNLYPGLQFDKLTLIEELGSGGNGAVWAADQDFGAAGSKRVAVKFLHRREGAALERFSGEIKTLINLPRHKNIVVVHGAGEYQNIPYYVMEYVNGNALYTHTEGRAFSLEQTITWLDQIASALDLLHARGVFHRDIKPDNILQNNDDGTLLLADFGLYYSERETDERRSLSDEKVGTRYYMAPEQVPPPWQKKKGEVTAQTDIYSLGIVAYELLTGGVPFPIPDFDPLKAHVDPKILLPSHERLTDEVLAVLRRACAKEPALRPESAGEFIAALRKAAKGELSPDRVTRYLVAWAEETGAVFEQEFDVQDLLRADVTHAENEVIEQQAPMTRSQKRLQSIKGKRKSKTKPQASVAPEGDYQKHDAEQSRRVENVRDVLISFEHGVLLGQPGSGKSWTLRRLMVDYLQRWRENPDSVRIPVFVPLNEYRGKVSFEVFVQQQMGALGAHYDSLYQGGKLALLCDALNEMPNQEQTLDTVREYLQAAKSHVHFIVSCRVLDYQRQLDSLRPLEMITLRELDLPAIQRFVMTYYEGQQGETLWRLMGGSDDLFTFWNEVHKENEGARFWDKTAGVPGYTSVSGDEAWRQMHSGAGLIPLCRSPFMAALVCELYDPNNPDEPLPQSRGDIFAGFVAAALEEEAERAAERGAPFPPIDTIEAALVDLARAMQERKGTVLPRTGDDAPSVMSQHAALIDAAINASILSGDSEQVKFAHQLFQEYFAARILLDAMERGQSPDTLITGNWWEPGVWRETAVILGEVADVNEVVAWLAPYSPWLALQVLTENAQYQAGEMPLSASNRERLLASANSHKDEPNPVGRAAAYRVLGHPDVDGDHRDGIGLDDNGLPDFDWVSIPAGAFIYQQDEKRTIHAFEISRYLLTYRQFQAFVDDDENDFNDLRWWSGLAADEDDRQLSEQYFKYWNHPRENISWYDAMAFCRWYSWRVGKPYGLDEIDQWAIRLPTEHEWERAARGTDGLIYPYGNNFDATKGNTIETGIGQTSAVGIFKAGASSEGVLDMSGNVWEWCLNEYESGHINANSASRRALRGGSWGYDHYYARAASRNGSYPDYRNLFSGVRFVRSPS